MNKYEMERINKYHNKVLNLINIGRSVEYIQKKVKVYSAEYIEAIAKNDFSDVIVEKDIDVFKTLHAKGYSAVEIAERTGYSIRYLENLSSNRDKDKEAANYSLTVQKVLYEYLNCMLYGEAQISAIEAKTGASKGVITRIITKFKASMGMHTITNLDTIIDQYKSGICNLDISKNLGISISTVRVNIANYRLRLYQLVNKNSSLDILLINHNTDAITPVKLVSLENKCRKAGIDPLIVLDEFKTGKPIYDNVDIIIKNPIDDEEYMKYSNGQVSKYHGGYVDDDTSSDEELKDFIDECNIAAAEEELNDILDNMPDKTSDEITRDKENEDIANQVVDMVLGDNNKTDALSLMMIGNEVLKALYNSLLISDEQSVNLKVNVEDKVVIIEPNNSVYDSITIKLK